MGKEKCNIQPATTREQLFSDINNILNQTRQRIVSNVNSAVVDAYWQIGRYIVEYEQSGSDRAQYGKSLIDDLATYLTSQYGAGFNATNLRYMRQFYQCFPIHHTVCDKLSWSHVRTILKIKDEKARLFYINECYSQNWSVRQLERQINTLYYDRLLASRNKESVRSEIASSVPTEITPKEIIRDPYVLEFLGIPQGEHFLESNLEEMLISKLQHFLLELGKGYTFQARQYPIVINNEHYYIDLVFYHKKLHCPVLIDLKIGAVKHKDIGQMNMYMGYFAKEELEPGDNPPIGIILSREKDELMVEYATYGMDQNLFVSKYELYLPDKEQLRALIAETLSEHQGK